MKQQQGYISLAVIIFLIILSMIFYPYVYPKETTHGLGSGGTITRSSNSYCGEIITGSSKTITVPSTGKVYRLIKSGVLMSYYKLWNNRDYNHLGSREYFQDPETGDKYIIRDPGKSRYGTSYEFASDLDPKKTFTFNYATYGIIYLFHTDDDIEIKKDEEGNVLNKYEPVFTTLEAGGSGPLIAGDFYQAVDAPELPPEVFLCNDYPSDPAMVERLGEAHIFNKPVIPTDSTSKQPVATRSAEQRQVDTSIKIYMPSQQTSPDQDQLQLQWFMFGAKPPSQQVADIYTDLNWWVPHCKPAVYLYPEKKELVNVQVFPKGELTYTDPVYDPVRGWTVIADPTGKLFNESGIMNNAQYDYLYYESKLLDSEIKVPKTGWSVKYSDMENLLNRILPKLGLNSKEEKDFKDYWLTKLPKSNYYFVGLVDKTQRDYLEALQVTPTPDTSIRFSLFFEPIDQPKAVEEPNITTPKRNGFTLVDWGGMIKLHKDTPFTCSQ